MVGALTLTHAETTNCPSLCVSCSSLRLTLTRWLARSRTAWSEQQGGPQQKERSRDFPSRESLRLRPRAWSHGRFSRSSLFIVVLVQRSRSVEHGTRTLRFPVAGSKQQAWPYLLVGYAKREGESSWRAIVVIATVSRAYRAKIPFEPEVVSRR